MKTFLFCIGGSGARVLRAFTMLMATDVKLETDEVIPIIIDMDERNGDFRRCTKLLSTYKNISTELGSSCNYFSTSVNTLQDNFELSFANSNQTFSDYLKIQRLSQLNRDFLTSLYDNSEESNPNAELQLKMNLGFQGNPNMGSVIFHELKNSEAYAAFEGQMTEGDKIVIVSSIFGGTGSSGFPQLVRILRESQNIPVNNADISAIIIKPYFQVLRDSNSSINSDLFNSKTKAALNYYIRNLKNDVNRFYFLADRPGVPIKNIKGGKSQKNDAHFIEFIAATGIAHAIQNHDNDKYLAFGLKELESDLQSIDFKDFYQNERWEKLLKFSYFAKFYLHGLGERTGETFFIQLDMANQLSNKPFFTNLKNFLQDYWKWLRELEISQRSFNPFNLEDTTPFSLFLKGREYKILDKTSGVAFGIGAKDYFSGAIISELNRLEGDGALNTPQKYTRSTFNVVNKVYSDIIQSLPNR